METPMFKAQMSAATNPALLHKMSAGLQGPDYFNEESPQLSPKQRDDKILI